MNISRNASNLNLASFVAVLAMSVLIPRAVIGQSQYTIDDVRKAWEARQARVESAEFTWEVTEFIAAKSRVKPPFKGKSLEELPEEDTTITRMVTVALSGRMLHYSYEGQFFSSSRGSTTEKRYVSVFDGEVSKNFHDIEKEEHVESRYPRSGFIRKEAIHYDLGNWQLAPIQMTCRPCDAAMGGVDLERYEISPRLESLGDTTCLIIKVKPSQVDPSTLGEREIWLEPQTGFIVRRIVQARQDAPPLFTIDITYARNDACGWVPKAWKYFETDGDGNTRTQVNAGVTKCKINAEIPRSMFEFDFPPGTAVVDNRSGVRYIARAESEIREVTNEELARGAKYADLLSTESGMALPNSDPAPGDDQRQGREAVWWYLISAMVVVAVAIWFVYRSRSSPTG